MMMWSVLEPNDPESRVMYRNLRNLVERDIMQQAEIDRQFTPGTESCGPNMTSSWSRGAQPSKSTKTCVPMKDRLGGIRNIRHIPENWR